MDDTVVIITSRPALGQTATVTLPVGVVAVLQYLADHQTKPDPNNLGQTIPRYTSALNVIWSDIMIILLPYWKQVYLESATKAAKQTIQSTAEQAVDAAVAQITMVETL